MNSARSALLLAAMTALFLAIGYTLGGEGGMIVALLIAIGINAFATGRNPEHAAAAVTTGLMGRLT